jgi:hypothetical protein
MATASNPWLARAGATISAFVVTAGVLLATRSTTGAHDTISADRFGERGFVAARPASTGTSASALDSAHAPTPASPLAMHLKDDGEDPSAAWPPGFQATPERPTPLTMCLKHDSIDGKPICPNAQAVHRGGRSNPLSMPLR